MRNHISRLIALIGVAREGYKRQLRRGPPSSSG